MTPSEPDYRTIPLTKGLFAIVDLVDYDHLMQWRWQASAQHHKGWRAKRCSKKLGKQFSVLMHRQIMDCPKGMVIDHINGNALDNRRANLRICTSQQNSFNIRKRKPGKYSEFKGVHPNRAKWRACIMKEGKYIHIGNFETEQDAALAYDAMARLIFGQFAHLNFPQ